MKAQLIEYLKTTDEIGNILEIKIWQLPESTKDKSRGYKYSIVYIVNGERIIGYDNAEGKGDHRHYKGKEEPYNFKDIDTLFEDFYNDIRRFKNEG
jgi:hypothetical protein